MGKDFDRYFRRKHVDSNAAIEYLLVNNGITHLAYKSEGIHDVISPHSVKGYEYLADEMAGYLEFVEPIIPENMPVVLEITGHEFSDEEQRSIEKAVLNHFLIKTVAVQRDRGNLFWRIGWFALFLAGFSFVMFYQGGLTGSIGQGSIGREFMYVLFYFLGDRLIDYSTLGQREVKKRKTKLSQIATMKVVFTKEPLGDLTDEQARKVCRDVIRNATSENL